MSVVFGERLRQLREDHELTQAGLGLRLGVTGAAVGQWEQGRRLPDSAMLQKLADLFTVSIDYLLGRSAPSTGSDPDPQVRAILRSMKGLSEVERQDVLNYIAWKQAQLRQKKQQESDPQGEFGLI